MARLLSSSWSVTTGRSHDGVSLRSQNGLRDLWTTPPSRGQRGNLSPIPLQFGEYLERIVKKRKRKISIARIVILESRRICARRQDSNEENCAAGYGPLAARYGIAILTPRHAAVGYATSPTTIRTIRKNRNRADSFFAVVFAAKIRKMHGYIISEPCNPKDTALHGHTVVSAFSSLQS